MVPLSQQSGERIRIGGIKLSAPLSLYSLDYRDDNRSILHAVLRHLADNQINIPYLCHGVERARSTTTFCIPYQGSDDPFEDFLDNFRPQLLPMVGTLTMFPHRSSIAVLTSIVDLLLKHDLAVHGFCTSISAFTLVTEYDLLDDCVTLLLKIFELPENHAPLRQEFTIRQITM